MAKPDPAPQGNPQKPGPAPAAPANPAAAPAKAPAAPANAPVKSGEPSITDQAVEWARTEGPWWAASFVFHMLLVCVLMLVSTQTGGENLGDAPSFDEAKVEERPQEQKLDRFEVGEAPMDPTELNTDTLTLNQAPGGPAQTEVFYDDNPVFIEAGGGVATSMQGPQLGGLGGFSVVGSGPGIRVSGAGGVGVGSGTGTSPGSGGGGTGFGGRGQGHRKAMVGGFGGTKQSERAVAAALNWIARHQNSDGSWSLGKYSAHCKDPTCTGPGSHNADAGATALALLPYLAAGQTHENRGPYQQTIYRGLYWLMQHQKPNGDLSGGAGQSMYAHGLASITLCEAFGLTKDKMVGKHAQAAIKYIESAQHPRTGGWRYSPGEEGDTSVVGWQVMALKSGHMAGLPVNQATFEGAKQFLKSCSSGSYGGNYCYTPGGAATPTMTAVGLLCQQYMGVRPDNPLMQEGVTTLLRQQPDSGARSLYYWYYATQVMHNVPGPEWDQWNRKQRRVLIETQCKDGCATGSWDPDKPTKDPWGDAGGRIFVTSLSALTLEVYYRYLPLYKVDAEHKLGAGAAAPAAKEAPKGASAKESPKAAPAKEAPKPAAKESPKPAAAKESPKAAGPAAKK